MPTLPIPLFGAVVLAFLFCRLWLRDRRIGPLTVLLGLCGVQLLIISLAQHYRVPGTHLVQPVTATLIPPAAWVGFLTTAVRPWRRADVLHLLGPLAVFVALVVQPVWIDALIPLLFVGYGGAILWQSLRGADALPRLSLGTGDLPAKIWVIIGCVLIAAAFSDILIIAAQIAGLGHLQPWIISLYSVVNLMIIGGLSLTDALQAQPEEETASEPSIPIQEADHEAMEKLDRLMQAERPFLDPDLTLLKLARKIGVPAKSLSSAINKTTGQNVSRYINASRIEEARRLLKAGESVTTAMFASGFNTKSNFNREFLRVTGQSPSDWLRDSAEV